MSYVYSSHLVYLFKTCLSAIACKKYYFIGIEGDTGAKLELPPDFAYRIVKHVGNYSEVYERNIGKPVNLERGVNSLWLDSGLMYSPPFR
jgi:general L-amino acid transport system substrate-binding protein